MDILINKETNIEDLLKIFKAKLSKKKQIPDEIFLKIDYAKHFPMDKILELGKLVSWSNQEVYARVHADIDFTEFVFAALCNTAGLSAPDNCNINMVSQVQVSKEDLTKIAIFVSQKTDCKVMDVIQGYEYMTIIQLKDLLNIK